MGGQLRLRKEKWGAPPVRVAYPGDHVSVLGLALAIGGGNYDVCAKRVCEACALATELSVAHYADGLATQLPDEELPAAYLTFRCPTLLNLRYDDLLLQLVVECECGGNKVLLGIE
jgi:hypothetical protein